MSSIRELPITLFCILLLPLVVYAQKEVYIDLSLQRLYALEDGQTVFEGRISSGKVGHETPTGRFSVLQKERMHRSNLYPEPNGGAKMPYMMRLTWDGVAMHQGYVPNRPASHGCIRLTKRTARKLYHWVERGTPVVIGGDSSQYATPERGYVKDEDGYAIIEVYE